MAQFWNLCPIMVNSSVGPSDLQGLIPDHHPRNSTYAGVLNLAQLLILSFWGTLLWPAGQEPTLLGNAGLRMALILVFGRNQENLFQKPEVTSSK